MEKLISMTDFVLEQSKLKTNNTELEIGFMKSADAMYKYAHFLKQPLKLSMFIPCDFYDTPLQETFFDENAIHYMSIMELYEKDKAKHNEYLKAKEKVLFEGFYIYHENSSFIHITKNDNSFRMSYEKESGVLRHIGQFEISDIESLAMYSKRFNEYFPADFILTESAIKQWNLS